MSIEAFREVGVIDQIIRQNAGKTAQVSDNALALTDGRGLFSPEGCLSLEGHRGGVLGGQPLRGHFVGVRHNGEIYG